MSFLKNLGITRRVLNLRKTYNNSNINSGSDKLDNYINILYKKVDDNNRSIENLEKKIEAKKNQTAPAIAGTDQNSQQEWIKNQQQRKSILEKENNSINTIIDDVFKLFDEKNEDNRIKISVKLNIISSQTNDNDIQNVIKQAITVYNTINKAKDLNKSIAIETAKDIKNVTDLKEDKRYKNIENNDQKQVVEKIYNTIQNAEKGVDDSKIQLYLKISADANIFEFLNDPNTTTDQMNTYFLNNSSNFNIDSLIQHGKDGDFFYSNPDLNSLAQGNGQPIKKSILYGRTIQDQQKNGGNNLKTTRNKMIIRKTRRQKN
jgi:ribosomal protein L12E/L44/L45/RPP1/RPP2